VRFAGVRNKGRRCLFAKCPAKKPKASGVGQKAANNVADLINSGGKRSPVEDAKKFPGQRRRFLGMKKAIVGSPALFYLLPPGGASCIT
jgi:hypothetical protein